MQPQHLIKILTPYLESLGFWRFPHMDYFVRIRGDVRDVIGWYAGVASSRYCVYFSVWVPELEPDLTLKNIDESSHIRNLSLAHDLSLAHAHKLSEWWDDEQGYREQVRASLLRQVSNIALPYFDTFTSVGDVAEMVFHDERFHNTEMEGRLLDNAFSSFFHYDIEHVSDQVAQALKPLQRTSPAFEYSGGYHWRHYHDGVFHVIIPQYYAAWRFVQIQVAVWHPQLDNVEDIPQTLPPAFSRVAWKTFSDNGEDKSDAFPAFLGESEHKTQGLEDQINGLRTHGLPWLESVRCFNDVRHAIRPELMKFYP